MRQYVNNFWQPVDEITRPCCGRGLHVYIVMDEITRP